MDMITVIYSSLWFSAEVETCAIEIRSARIVQATAPTSFSGLSQPKKRTIFSLWRGEGIYPVASIFDPLNNWDQLNKAHTYHYNDK